MKFPVILALATGENQISREIDRKATDNKGCFAFSRFPPGSYKVVAVWPSHHPRAEELIGGAASDKFSVNAGQTVRSDVNFQTTIAVVRARRAAENAAARALDSPGRDGLENTEWAKPDVVMRNINEWRSMAQAGDSEWQYRLGILYDTGRGVTQDSSEAFKWFLRSAEAGHPGSFTAVGLQYLSGRGVPQSRDKGMAWLTRGADKNEASAIWALGNLYAEGRLVPQDYVEAYMWFNLIAASPGWERAARLRDQIASRMTAEQIARGQSLTQEWRPKADPHD